MSTKRKEGTFVVKRSASGLGLFANTPYKRGAYITEYVGEHISHDESDRRGGKYLFILNKKIVVDGKSRKNIARYINHSCKPNAEAETDDEDEKIRGLAKRNILPGEEITYDYGKEYWEEYIKPNGCTCSACQKTPNKK